MAEVAKRLRRNPSAVAGGTLVGVLVLAGLFAPLLTPYDPTKQELLNVLQGPSWAHPLGTDNLGRDILARLLYGARLTLFMGVFAVGVGLVVGVPLGVLSGYYRGWVDMAIQRVMDLMLSFTTFLLALALVSLLGVGLINVIVAVGISTIPRFARLVRSSVLTIREVAYVEASSALGARDGRDDEEHDRRLMDLAAAFENPPEWAEDADMSGHADESANMADVPDEYIFSNPGEAVSKAQEMGLDGPGDEIIHTHGEGEDTVFMPAASHDDLMEMLREEGELAPSAEFSEGDLVRWSTSASPGTGRVAEVASEPGESVSAEGADVTREATEDEAAYKLDDYVGPEAGYDEGVVVKSASEILGAWDDAPEAAEMAATDDADSPDSGRAEAGGERTDTQTTTENAHMSETEEELRARLSEKDDRIAELQNEVEQLEDEREDVARAYAEALAAGDTVFDEDDLVEKFTVAELAERYESVEDATLADTEPTVQSGDSDTETATLSESEQDEVADLRAAIEDLSGSETRLAEIQREQHAERIAELTGEDTEAVLAEY